MGNNSRHGHAGNSADVGRTPTYSSWHEMMQRVNNPRHHAARNYSRRGVVVCDRWRDFVCFLVDMGERPSSSHTLDRINNNGNYEPGNVRWATRSEQADNRRNTVRLTAYGVTMTRKQWSREHGVKSDTIQKRLEAGWSVSRAVVPHFTEADLCLD